MKQIPTQIKFDEYDEEYKAFVDKFKPKKTTDDCYTPPEVFEAVVGWVCNEYEIDREQIVRPFWPGGDYERYPYKETDVVLDNPPFSIITPIVKFYLAHEIKFFLFAPHLTNFQVGGDNVCHVIENVKVTYENGAVVNTSFVTNLDEHLIIASPELYNAVKEANQKNESKAPPLPVYEYPPEIVTATMIGGIVAKGVPFKLNKDDAIHIRSLEQQRTYKKSIFGSGFLISEKAAAEKERLGLIDKKTWILSEKERALVEQLNERSRNG